MNKINIASGNKIIMGIQDAQVEKGIVVTQAFPETKESMARAKSKYLEEK